MWKRITLLLLSILGLLDALYLTYEHYMGVIPPCGEPSFFSDCGKVLTSVYATPLGVPLALIGVIFYTVEVILMSQTRSSWARKGAIITTTGGFAFSLMFVYIQIFVIGGICRYCMVSAFISTILFFTTITWFSQERKQLTRALFGFGYRTIIKPLFFRFNPENVHNFMVSSGSMMGNFSLTRFFMRFSFQEKDLRLEQTIAGVTFPNPIGLAAGFDYEAQLTQILGPLGFGFQTVGTMTNHPYEGNPRPMLGRLPLSKSLMVNKGFKNPGAQHIAASLQDKHFPVPVGISVGVTNSASMTTTQKAITDIKQAFTMFEKHSIHNAYYELNISCPNLKVGVSFYDPKNLDQLLAMIDALKLNKPVFIKMPIEKSEKEYKSMLDIIIRHHIAGVIIGNLSKDRKNPALHPNEVNKYAVGNFSGKPTWESSNQLISYTSKQYGKKLVIIGCGGVFSAEDALEKFKRGASLVQLITGMIYQGPQLISEINEGLVKIMEQKKIKQITSLHSLQD